MLLLQEKNNWLKPDILKPLEVLYNLKQLGISIVYYKGVAIFAILHNLDYNGMIKNGRRQIITNYAVIN